MNTALVCELAHFFAFQPNTHPHARQSGGSQKDDAPAIAPNMPGSATPILSDASRANPPIAHSATTVFDVDDFIYAPIAVDTSACSGPSFSIRTSGDPLISLADSTSAVRPLSFMLS